MTHVSRLELDGVFNHQKTVLDLPARGVVLVTGPNGAGKSSLPEGVAVAGWGKTLRGTSPWATMTKGKARAAMATADVPLIERTKTPKGNPKLSWTDGQKKHGSTAKSQAELEAHLGSFDVWRRAQVFSSSDASHFTRATDKERKAFLEDVLGLDIFDSAVAACRADLKEARTKHQEARRGLELKETELAEVKRRLAQAQGQLEALEAPVAPEGVAGDVEELKADLAECKADAARLDAELRALNQQVLQADMRVRSARTEAKRLADDTCPTCAQPIPAELKERLAQAVTEAEAAAKAAAEEAEANRGSLEEELAELGDEAGAIRGSLSEAETMARLQAQHDRAVAGFERQLKNLQRDVDAAQGATNTLAQAIAVSQDEVLATAVKVAQLEACERVLGLQGVRAHVLGQSLGGIETLANTWMVKLRRPDVQVQLLPYTENKTGGVRDSISLVVEGAGNGLGYQAASGGERRRLDVALLFALSEVAGAAHGQSEGTLWFDEVFDALDTDGVSAVVDALKDLAGTRAVVVITHNEELVAQLPDAMRVHVAGGRVTV